jgi:hypothetical protein
MHIVGYEGLGNIACHCGDRVNLQLVGCEGEKDRNRVVLAGIRIDYQ